MKMTNNLFKKQLLKKVVTKALFKKKDCKKQLLEKVVTKELQIVTKILECVYQ